MRNKLLKDLQICLGFYSRLPTPLVSNDCAMPDFSRVTWAAPLAGAVIGAISALSLLLSAFFHLPDAVSAVLAVGVLVLTTGALHEDGLADFSDSFGGVTREQKLSIMRDSRVGSYGVLALVFSVFIRSAAVFSALGHGAAFSAMVVVASAALSRAVGLVPLSTLSPARMDGAGASVAQPTMGALRVALGLGVLFGLSPALVGAPLGQAVAAVLIAIGGGFFVSRLAAKQIGGYTGDVLGATQQIAEIGALICFSA